MTQSKEFIARLQDGQFTRRQALKALGAMGFAVGAVPLGMRSALAADNATYFTWGGYDDDGMFAPYIAQHGGPPNYVTFGDAEEGFTKMKAGFVVDVTHPCSNDIPRWKDSGMFQGMDKSRLSSYDDLFGALVNLPGANDSAGQWFMPFDWGATSITYRTDLVDLEGKAESWEMLFDPRYKGKIAVIDSAADTWYCMAILAGVDIGKPLTGEDIDKTNALMKKLRPQVRMFTNDMTSLQQALASGEIVMALTWNETPVALAAEGHAVRFAGPKEGALTWCCGLMMHKDAPNLDGAYDIVNAMTSRETGVYVIDYWGYGHSNSASFKMADPGVLAQLGLDKDPIAYLNAGHMGIPQSDEVETRINRDFEAIKTGF